MNTIDLFCGGGGLSCGLERAGFKILAAYDWWEPALVFYNRNHKGCGAHRRDLSDVDKIIQSVKDLPPVDVIAGGPPCQDFSSAGKRNENGERANLTIAFAQIVSRIHPRIFIMENVARAAKTNTFAKAMSIFRDSGYGITEAILDASLCGVPQKRKRVFVVGILGGGNNVLTDIYKSRQRSTPMSVKEYFKDTLDISYYYRHPRSYARRAVFSVDEPSPTIRGVNRPVPSGYPGHPGDATPVFKGLRALTTRERAMIQTFPSDWVLEGNKSDLEQIIGNAVPVKLAEFVGECLMEYLDHKEQYDNLCKKNELFLFEQHARYGIT